MKVEISDEQKRLNSIKTLTRTYFDYQDERIALDGRLGVTKSGVKKKGSPEKEDILLIHVKDHRDSCLAMEETIAKDLAVEVHKHPLWKNFLCDVKGVGHIIAAVIISEFDIHRFVNVSKGWQFAGLNSGMVPGKKWNKGKTAITVTTERVQGDKKTKGFLCPCNMFLKKMLLGVLGPSFLKCKSPYTEFYYNIRHRYESENWGIASKNPTDKKLPKANHQHRAANRYMVKQFVADLYEAWRRMEGLPVREPYQQEYLGHTHNEVK